jgi:hypothetical protein
MALLRLVQSKMGCGQCFGNRMRKNMSPRWMVRNDIPEIQKLEGGVLVELGPRHQPELAASTLMIRVAAQVVSTKKLGGSWRKAFLAAFIPYASVCSFARRIIQGSFAKLMIKIDVLDFGTFHQRTKELEQRRGMANHVLGRLHFR